MKVFWKKFGACFAAGALVEKALERRKLNSSALDGHITYILEQPKTNHTDPCHIHSTWQTGHAEVIVDY